MIFEPHSDKQEEALFATKRITLCSTGIQWGKTTIGALKLKLLIHENPGEGCNYIVTAPNYKIMEQATLPALLKVMEGCGTYRKADAIFELHSGALIFCRTATDPDSVVGITNVYGIWGDEAGKYPHYFWINIQGRSRFKQCPIILTTSLYSFNWVCKELIRQVERGQRDDVHLCQAESRENPYFPEAEYEAAKKTMSPSRFAMMYGGRPSRNEGTVYDVFDEDTHVVQPFALPSATLYYAGIDWGYTQPFACVVVARLPNGRCFVVGELVKSKMIIDDIIEALSQLQKIFGIQRFYAGPDQPGSIKALNKSGLSCSAADNNVKDGVELVYGLLKSAELKFFYDKTPVLLDGMENYHWPELKDLNPNQDEKDPNPVKQDDHALDALRYCMVSIAKKKVDKQGIKRPENKQPNQETVEQRLKRLKKKKKAGQSVW